MNAVYIIVFDYVRYELYFLNLLIILGNYNRKKDNKNITGDWLLKVSNIKKCQYNKFSHNENNKNIE